MDVRQAIAKHVGTLQRARIDVPRLECELLLAHLLGITRTQLLAELNRQLPTRLTSRLGKMVARRAARVPHQLILGTVSFRGHEIRVNRHVLIPRPETEQLVEEAIRRLATIEKPRVLDIGTGSGCLAISIAAEHPSARVDALDISRPALAIARKNALLNRVASRLRFVLGDSRSHLPTRVRYHAIVSNPPYIPSAQISRLQPEVRDHDPRLALDGGPDGLEFYHAIASHAACRLRSGGQLLLEIGDSQAQSVRHLLTAQNWRVEKILPDLAGISRIVVATPPDP